MTTAFFLLINYIYMQIILWIMGVVAAYRLWGHVTWLSMVVILLAFTYELHPDEQQEYKITGTHSKPAATRLMWTFVLVVIIFLYSLFA